MHLPAIFGAEKILKDAGLSPSKYDGTFQREVIDRLGAAIRNSLSSSTPVTQVGYGEAKVYQVASNRRILGKDGHILPPRLSACKDSALRAQPEGLIDPKVRTYQFLERRKSRWAVLSYYAHSPAELLPYRYSQP